MPPYRSLDFTSEFLDAFSDLGQVEQRRIRAALLRLDADDRHPSLWVHQLQGDLAGQWSASASDSLRITFRREPNGRRVLLGCSRHYGE